MSFALRSSLNSIWYSIVLFCFAFCISKSWSHQLQLKIDISIYLCLMLVRISYVYVNSLTKFRIFYFIFIWVCLVGFLLSRICIWMQCQVGNPSQQTRYTIFNFCFLFVSSFIAFYWIFYGSYFVYNHLINGLFHPSFTSWSILNPRILLESILFHCFAYNV